MKGTQLQCGLFSLNTILQNVLKVQAFNQSGVLFHKNNLQLSTYTIIFVYVVFFLIYLSHPFYVLVVIRTQDPTCGGINLV